jgi:hypothetical protein
MRTILPLVLWSGVILAACSGGAEPTLLPGERLPVEIEAVDSLQLESYPVQIMLHVTGWLPNPCSDAAWEIDETDPKVVEVELYAVAQDVEACIQVLAPFDVNIPLGAVEGRQIIVNGEDASQYPTG